MRSSSSTAGGGTERFGDGGDAAGQKQRRRRRVERTSMLGSPRALWMVSSRSPWSSCSPEPDIPFAGRQAMELRGWKVFVPSCVRLHETPLVIDGPEESPGVRVREGRMRFLAWSGRKEYGDD
jgi:hypothetical protein